MAFCIASSTSTFVGAKVAVRANGGGLLGYAQFAQDAAASASEAAKDGVVVAYSAWGPTAQCPGVALANSGGATATPGH